MTFRRSYDLMSNLISFRSDFIYSVIVLPSTVMRACVTVRAAMFLHFSRKIPQISVCSACVVETDSTVIFFMTAILCCPFPEIHCSVSGYRRNRFLCAVVHFSLIRTTRSLRPIVHQ